MTIKKEKFLDVIIRGTHIDGQTDSTFSILKHMDNGQLVGPMLL